MVAGPASIYVQDHGFLITDRDVEMPFETMDYSTGLAGVTESAALLYAGVDRGHVTVSAQPVDDRPEIGTKDQWADLAVWDDVAEISLHAPNGCLTVEQLEYGPVEAHPEIPVLSPYGPGHYRLRIHARGRDRHYDQAMEQSDERYHVIAWPAPQQAPLVIKAASWCGYGLRLNAQSTPSAAEQPATAEEQADAERQAMLRRRLLDI